MKIVKNYKGLKKWAKTTFIALLTICIIFTTTGVGTLIAYAEPHVHVYADRPQYNGDGTHIGTCSICGEEYSEPCSEGTYAYDEGDATQHYKTCTECPRYEAEPHSFDADGNCVCGYHQDQTSEPDNSESAPATSPSRGVNNDPASSPDPDDDDSSPLVFSLRSTPLPDGDRNDWHYWYANEAVPSTSIVPYTGDFQVLLSSVPVAREEIKACSWFQTVFCTAPSGNTNYAWIPPSASISRDGYKATGTYTINIGASLTNSGSDYTVLTYTVTIPKRDISTLVDITPSYDATTGATSLSIKSFSGTETLVENTDYTMEVPILYVPLTGSYSINLTGIGDNYTGTKAYEVANNNGDTGAITYKFKSSASDTSWSGSKAAFYPDQVLIKAEGYKVSTNPSGPFNEYITYTTPGQNQTVTLYIMKDNAAANTVFEKQVTGISISESVPIKYNSSRNKASKYTNQVTISADGYTVSTSSSGPFNPTYVHKTIGANQTFTLYFRDKVSGTVYPKTITDITVVAGEEDESAIKGEIVVDTYSSKILAKEKETVYITREKKEIEINASNPNSVITSVEYFTSDKLYVSKSELEGAVTDGKAKWKTYYKDGKPTLTENTGEYIYAKITDEAGNVKYLSTGKIIYDTKAPTVNTITLAEGNDGMLAVLTGKDNLSGIEKFYLRYVEKQDKNTTPTAQEVIQDNWVTIELTGDELAAGGSFKMPKELDPKKTYIFYGVAVDKAGNISEVKVYETKGKASKAASASKNSVDNPAGGSDGAGGSGSGGSGSGGLAAAPNGIAGSGGGNPNPSSATSNWANKTETAGSSSPLEREINRVPYISDATGDTKIGLEATGGWDKIESEVTKAETGTRMSVDMAGLSVMPNSLVSAMRDKDVRVTLKMADDIEWVIDGKDVDRVIGSDIDLRINRDTRTIPTELLNDIVDAYPHTEIDIAHSGDFGFTATLRVPFGESSAGMYGNLYYYDEQAGELKLIQASQIGNDGYAEFELDHASGYTIVVRSVDMAEALGTAEATSVSTLENTQVDISNAKAELSLLPQTGRSILGMRIWLFVMAVICAAMCLAILFVPSFQRETVYNEM